MLDIRVNGRFLALLLALPALLAACVPAVAPPPECDPDDGGLVLADGFCALVFADVGGRVRHITVRPNGDVFVAAYAGRGQGPAGGVVSLRDTTGDGRADVTERFGSGRGGSGIAASETHVWLGMDGAVLRFAVPAGDLLPGGTPDTIVSGLPADRSHRAKSLALSGDGRIFVNIGSPTNSCQQEDRQAGSPGIDPCPDLETRAGVWVFDANRPGQTQADGQRFASGIRNSVALTVNPADGRLYVAQHGRDQLSANWGSMFTEAQSAETPAEELFAVEEGDDFGWPYCYYDGALQRKVLAPEYGGDGQAEGRCATAKGPIFAFPGHWAPNALLFGSSRTFPDRYDEGVFVAFHGSWNRAPLPQGGYNVVFLPFDAGAPLASFQVFADGFAGEVKEPGQAEYRPTGLAWGPDGSLYITDDQAGRIWRVIYRVE